jgi:SH3-like domain-containing protein
MTGMGARLFISILLFIGMTGPVQAQDREVPYWASIRASVLNMRVGPSADYKIDWVYRRPGLPVKVLRLMEGWRLIEDPDGARGWVVARLLDPARGAIVIGDGLADMRASDSPQAPLKWRIEPGVVGTLGDCEDGWCEFAVGKRAGYIRESRLWGAGEP